MENPVAIYQDEAVSLEIRLDESQETIWLTQQQIASLYTTTQQNVDLHIKNIYKELELEPEATYKKFLLVRNEGGRSVAREVAHYSLDMIISVGYRINSQQATRFRQWATRILKSYIVHGGAHQREGLGERYLLEKLTEIEARLQAHDDQFEQVFEALRQLLMPPEAPPKQIGFRTQED